VCLGTTYPPHSGSQAGPHPAEESPSGRRDAGSEGYRSRSSYSSANRQASPAGSHSWRSWPRGYWEKVSVRKVVRALKHKHSWFKVGVCVCQGLTGWRVSAECRRLREWLWSAGCRTETAGEHCAARWNCRCGCNWSYCFSASLGGKKLNPEALEWKNIFNFWNSSLTAWLWLYVFLHHSQHTQAL